VNKDIYLKQDRAIEKTNYCQLKEELSKLQKVKNEALNGVFLDKGISTKIAFTSVMLEVEQIST